jgi:hypothetical protein
MQLVSQTYGIAMAQCTYGGPRGVWLECTACDRSDKIKGASTSISDAAAAAVFRRGGWTGKGVRMLGAKCPKCS